MWTIPGTGTDTRCDHESCPKRPEARCDDIYGISEGESCNVYCTDGGKTAETWTCAKGSELWESKWVLTSYPLVCEKGNFVRYILRQLYTIAHRIHSKLFHFILLHFNI